ncbi:MAG: DUF6751 family protein [Eubacterium sp.]
MRANTDITIVRIRADSKVTQSIVRGVSWQEERKNTVTDKGLLSADTISIYIPGSSVLHDTVIPKGDFVVKGIKDYTGLESKDLRRKMEQDGGVLIKSVQDNRNLGVRLGHIELGCE